MLPRQQRMHASNLQVLQRQQSKGSNVHHTQRPPKHHMHMHALCPMQPAAACRQQKPSTRIAPSAEHANDAQHANAEGPPEGSMQCCAHLSSSHANDSGSKPARLCCKWQQTQVNTPAAPRLWRVTPPWYDNVVRHKQPLRHRIATAARHIFTMLRRCRMQSTTRCNSTLPLASS